MIKKYREQWMTDTMKDILDEKQIDIFSIVWGEIEISTKKVHTIYKRGYSVSEISDILHSLKRDGILVLIQKGRQFHYDEQIWSVSDWFVDQYG